MDQPSTSERTPLVGSPSAPTYVFHSTSARIRHRRIKQIQCCICGCMLAIFALAVIITVSYGMDEPSDDDNNTTAGNLTREGFGVSTLLTLSWPRPDAVDIPSSPSSWSGNTSLSSALAAAAAAGTEALRVRSLCEAGAQPPARGSPTLRAQRALAAAPPAERLARAGYANVAATKHYAQRTSNTDWSRGRGPVMNASWSLPECTSPSPLSCRASRYRAINGSCNSRSHSNSWGVAFKPFRRVLPADYSDGVSTPRSSHSSTPLPSARQISLQVHRPVYRADPDFTVVLAVWGQFLDHDITATALSQGANGSAISCCDGYVKTGVLPHPECFPVELGPEDPNYHKYNVTCMDFVRSAPAPSCTLGPREQLNQATAFIDGSTVYGPYEDLMTSLRSFQNGELKMMTTTDGRELLPASHDPNDGCNEKKLNQEGKYCFLSGDIRANENLHLTTMHLLWARQHNRLARQLAQLNPHWQDETLFQEARRILGAQMQHVTYNEFLPVLMGDAIMDKLELSPKKDGYYHGYNASVDPSIANHFASSAFRFAHTLLPTLMKVVNSQTSSPEYVHLHKMLFNPYSLYTVGGMDSAIRGAMQTDMQRVDAFFTPELTSHLFKRDQPLEVLDDANITNIKPELTTPALGIQKSSPENVPLPAEHPMEVTAGTQVTKPCGLDLVSLNIQRGRDHGLPSYPSWRQHCGYQRPKTFRDLQGVIDDDSLLRIQAIYNEVEDVDLYTGALSEIPLDGSVLGASITCLLLDQFLRLKRGDRFWYETPEKPQAFTPDQLNEIRKTTLSGVICDNGDALEMAQKFVMRSVGPDNPLLSCNAISGPSMAPWLEQTPRVKMATDAGVHVIKAEP